jgi:Flp pilus assembly secretin CpaC
MKQTAAAIVLISLFLAAGKISAQEKLPGAETDRVLVYPSIAVTVNKSVVIRLPKRATRVAVTQPQIAEVVVTAPDELLINGKAVGTTSLVVWTEEPAASKE